MVTRQAHALYHLHEQPVGRAQIHQTRVRLRVTFHRVKLFKVEESVEAFSRRQAWGSITVSFLDMCSPDIGS